MDSAMLVIALYCIQNFPRFGRYFSDSYRFFPTATDFYRQLPKFTDSYRFFSTKNDRFFPTDSYVYTSEPLRLVYVHPLPFPQPPDPVPRPPDPARPFCPAGPVELRLPPPATCTKRPNFTDTATEFCRQLPNFSDRDTDFCRQKYRILPTEILNFAYRKEVGNELTFSPLARSSVNGCEDAPVERSETCVSSVSMCLAVRLMCLVVLCIATLCYGDSVSTIVTLSTQERNSPSSSPSSVATRGAGLSRGETHVSVH